MVDHLVLMLALISTSFMDGRTDGRAGGRTDGQTDGRMHGLMKLKSFSSV